MHAEECGANYTGLCAKMKPINGEKLLTFLRQVNFTGRSTTKDNNILVFKISFDIYI